MSATLVFGSSGQVARSLREVFTDTIFIGQAECPFTDVDAVVKVLNLFRPKVVINPAAFTNVDEAESNGALAMMINCEAPRAIARWCANEGASLVHFSTDYVYSGRGEKAWLEDDAPDPQNVYGASKLAGEREIAASGCHHIILRTSWIFAPWGRNFVNTMVSAARDRQTLQIVDDQFGAPTFAPDLAKVVLSLVRHPDFTSHAGLFNVANAGVTSWYEFANAIFTELRSRGVTLKVKDVIPVPSSQYPRPASRPKNSRLDLEKIHVAFDIRLRSWRAALAECLDRGIVSAEGIPV